MASWASSFEAFAFGVEEVTVDDLNIIVISSGSDSEGEVEEEPLPLVKPEPEEVEDWQVVYLTKPASAPLLILSSTSEEENMHVGVPLTGPLAISGGVVGAGIDQLPHAEFDVEVVEQLEEIEVVTEAVAAPISSRTRQRGRSLESPASGTDLWQRHPGPPAVLHRTCRRESPAWQFFSVPVGSNKATADKVRCIFCLQEVSRGTPSRINQTRGTLSMLRHLYIHHWDNMTASFQARYRESRCTALRRHFVPATSSVEIESMVAPLPSTSARASVSSSEPTQNDPWPDAVGCYVTFCILCDCLVIGRDVPYVNYKRTLREHCAVCPGH